MNITFTEAASRKIGELLLEESKDTYLRIAIKGGGCAGFQYAFTFDSANVDEDFIFLRGNAKIAIDFVSSQYLEGATIDYVEELMGAHFSYN